MKNRLDLHLMANKEKGFALPLAVLIGLILMGTGMTMMMRAQADQSKVIAQNARADGLRSSEIGVARVRDLLNSVRVMAKVPSNCTSGDCWQTVQVPSTGTPLREDLTRLNITTACGNDSRKNEIANKILAPTNQRSASPGLRDLASGEWFKLNDNRYYRVVGYNFTENNEDPDLVGLGVLTLEGRSRKSAATDLTKTLPDIDKDDNAASRNRVVVSIPILPSRPLAFDRTTVPALWISEGAPEDGAKFEGDVVIGDPNTEKDIECSISRDKIQQPTPAPNTPYKAQFFRDTFPSRKGSEETDVPEEQRNLELTSPETFPRLGDTKSPSGAYEYIVYDINLSGSDQITITPGERVVFYVKGNINGAIKHDCSSVSPPTVCKPGNLQIYADGEAGDLIGGTPDPEICLRGSERLEAFIFAPNYSLGKTGTGAFVGAAWGKNWGKNSGCASPNNTVAVTQGVEWTELITNLQPNPSKNLPRLDGIANWCEEPIDTAPGASECN
ncbi:MULTISPECIES: hypothetical protein [Microcystis]|uniref:hypothetical protein n=1 Tax=Microcystis TaxID=1125 RepID=UPI001680F3DD|nr:hypothetical protein [Microcystis wesenbergii FACHB-1339]